MLYQRLLEMTNGFIKSELDSVLEERSDDGNLEGLGKGPGAGSGQVRQPWPQPAQKLFDACGQNANIPNERA
jgi:hypothetical protein